MNNHPGTVGAARPFDVLAVGELVIDFSPMPLSSAGNPTYEQHPGGAASNVAAAVAKLGGNAAFMGAVGADEFGRFLRRTLQRLGVNDQWLVEITDAHTTLAFVHLDDTGERTFTTVGFPGAESRLTEDLADVSALSRTKLMHVSSAVLFADPSRTTALRLLEQTRSTGTTTSFDVNYRAALWTPDEARELAGEVLEFVDVLKVSLEELVLLTGTDDLARGSIALLDRGPKLIAVTLGAEGCFYATHDHSGLVPGYQTRVVDTNGAGDAFLAALLWQLTRTPSVHIDRIPPNQLNTVFDFCNAAGAIATSSSGAMGASPTLDEVAARQASVDSRNQPERTSGSPD